MYPVFVNGDWVDYDWLYKGCLNEQCFNWFYSLWTANNPDIRKLLEEGPYRKFVSSGRESILDERDMVSHYKRFSLQDVDNKLNIYMGDKIFIL